jgi:hypothetical protein
MRLTFLVVACAFFLIPVPAYSASIGLNFQRSSGEQHMAASEFAGVVPQVFWNNTDSVANGSSSANITDPVANAIVDDTGAVVPGVSITWTSNGTWSATNSGPGDPNLMAGYLDDTSLAGDTVVTVAGLPYAYYDVYAYVGSDANDRSGRIRVFDSPDNDRWFRTNTAPFTGFVEAIATTEPAAGTGLANYVRYRSVSANSFVLRAIRGSNNVGLHGLQIVETAPDFTGDYNNDNRVDAADFVVWRKNEGTTNQLPNDPIGGMIGQAHYNQWRANFGNAALSGAADAVVPEPTAMTLALLTLLGLARRRHQCTVDAQNRVRTGD